MRAFIITRKGAEPETVFYADTGRLPPTPERVRLHLIKTGHPADIQVHERPVTKADRAAIQAINATPSEIAAGLAAEAHKP